MKFSNSVVQVLNLTESLVATRNTALTALNIDVSGELTSDQKLQVKTLDETILTNTQLNYKVILGTNYHGTTSFDLDDLDKQRISQMISLFVDHFYSDYDPDSPSDTDGLTIEGITIDTYSLGFVNSELLTMINNRTTMD